MTKSSRRSGVGESVTDSKPTRHADDMDHRVGSTLGPALQPRRRRETARKATPASCMFMTRERTAGASLCG